MRGRIIFAVAALISSVVAAVAADNYPSRPITLIIPFAPGGPGDFVARLTAEGIGDELKQTVVVENRPGANGIIGAQAVATAKPDGYTLLMAIDGALVMNPFLYKNLSYDPFKDFAPVSKVAIIPTALVANNSVPANNIAELIKLEKEKPGRFVIGNSTPTSQVAIELLNMNAGTKMQVIPYRGGATGMTAVLGGEVPLVMTSITNALPHHELKKVKILALIDGERMSFAPDIPTIAETYPGFDLGLWQSVVAPAGTPKDIIMKLHGAIQRFLAKQSVRDRMQKASMTPSGSKSPEEFDAFIHAQAEVRKKVIEKIGLKFD